MNITLTQLQYLTAVDTYRNFVKAAESCHVTQPTLSMQINKLEEALGVKLIDRSRLPVAPTQIGTEIIEQARIVLNEAHKVKQIIMDMKGEVKGVIKVGIIPTLAPYIAPLFATHLVKKYPEVNISIVEGIGSELVEMLKSEQIDCAMMSPPLDVQDDLHSSLLFYESFIAYTHPNSSYYLNKKLKIEDINPIDLWLLSENHCLRQQVVHFCRDITSNSNVRIEFESSSLDALIRMVDRNRGITILPELSARDFSDKRKEKVREFIGKIPSREVRLYTHRAYSKKLLTDALSKAVIEVLPESMRIKKDRLLPN
jgi:LysR family transcriptional regulator, hydrogen peroxide-inducible genes activator